MLICLTFTALLELSTLRQCAEVLWLTSSGVGWLEGKKIKKIDLNQKNLI